MSAILHCIVTTIENNRTIDNIHFWKYQTNNSPYIKFKRLIQNCINREKYICDECSAIKISMHKCESLFEDVGECNKYFCDECKEYELTLCDSNLYWLPNGLYCQDCSERYYIWEQCDETLEDFDETV